MDSQGFIRHLSFLSGARALYKGTGATLLATSVMGFTSFGLNEFFRPCCSAVQQTSSERKSLCHAVMLRFTAGNRCELCNPWGHMRPSICFLNHLNTLSLSNSEQAQLGEMERRSLWWGRCPDRSGCIHFIRLCFSTWDALPLGVLPDASWHSLFFAFDFWPDFQASFGIENGRQESTKWGRCKNDQECHAAETCLD